MMTCVPKNTITKNESKVLSRGQSAALEGIVNRRNALITTGCLPIVMNRTIWFTKPTTLAHYRHGQMHN
jgi:hypothetical protein